jgi:hypothetical protein
LKLHEDSLKKLVAERAADDPVELFKAFISSFISTVAKHPELSVILLHDNSRTHPRLDHIIASQKRLHDFVEPAFKKAQACGYFQGVDHDSFTGYLRALVETPSATRDLPNHLLRADILSKKEIELHTKAGLEFSFPKGRWGRRLKR